MSDQWRKTRMLKRSFFRLLMFCHKTVLLVIRTYFRRKILENPDGIGSFLDLHKHELFHLVGDYKCCQCKELPSLQPRIFNFRLANQQFKKMYDIGNPQSDHFHRGSGGRIFQKCLCCISVKNETNVKNYDISLLTTILLHCGKLSDNNMKWVDTIRQSRNSLCHMTDLNNLQHTDITKIWGKLEMTVPKLAEQVDEDFKDSIDEHIDNYKHLDYNRDTVTPIMVEMRVDMNNMKECIQSETEEAVDHMNHLFLLSEEHRHLDKLETHKHILATNTDVVTRVAKYHADEMQGLENQTKAIKDQHEKICAIQKSVEDIKGNIKSFRREEVEFDIEVSTDSFVTENHECHTCNQHTKDENNALLEDTKSCMVVFTIGTPEGLLVRREEIMQYFRKAIDVVNIAAPFKVKFVKCGSIIVGTLLPVDITKNAKKFNEAIRIFLDQMVTKCGINTSIPLVVKVNITVSDFKKQASDTCFEEETNFVDKGEHAVPTMVDHEIEVKISELYPLYNNQDNPAAEIDDAEIILPEITTTTGVDVPSSLPVPGFFFKDEENLQLAPDNSKFDARRIETHSKTIGDIEQTKEASCRYEDETTDAVILVVANIVDKCTVKTFKESISEFLPENVKIADIIIEKRWDHNNLKTLDTRVKTSTIVFLLLSNEFIANSWLSVHYLPNVRNNIGSENLPIIVPVYLTESTIIPRELSTIQSMDFYNRDAAYTQGLVNLLKRVCCLPTH